MVPLAPLAARHVRSWLGTEERPGLLALRHALAYRRPGLWGDHPEAPESVVLVREGDDRLEAFGAGAPEPAVGWLAGQGRAFTLLAPGAWLGPVRTRVGGVGCGVVETWSLEPDPAEATEGAEAAAPRVATRRLTAADSAGFVAAAPAWGLRGWRTYPAMIGYGAAFGVPLGAGFASLAWVFDQAGAYAAIGVYTVPRFRRLGLGRAAASALVSHLESRRGKTPLWSVSPGNDASRGLARALGFTAAGKETLVLWPPRPPGGA